MLITVISLYYARAFLTTKLHILCKRIQNLQKSFFLNGTIGEFNYIYKSFLNVFCASNLPLHVVHILTFIQNIEFSFFFLFSLKFKVFNVPRGRTDLLHSATTGRNFSNDRIYCTDTCTSELIAISADEICVSFTCFFVFVCLFFFSPPPSPTPFSSNGSTTIYMSLTYLYGRSNLKIVTVLRDKIISNHAGHFKMHIN